MSIVPATYFSTAIRHAQHMLGDPGDSISRVALAQLRTAYEVLAANAKYAENFGDKGNLPLPPSRHFTIFNLYGCPS